MNNCIILHIIAMLACSSSLMCCYASTPVSYAKNKEINIKNTNFQNHKQDIDGEYETQQQQQQQLQYDNKPNAKLQYQLLNANNAAYDDDDPHDFIKENHIRLQLQQQQQQQQHQQHHTHQIQFIYDKDKAAATHNSNQNTLATYDYDDVDYAQQDDGTQTGKPSLLQQLQSQQRELSEGYAIFLRPPHIVQPATSALPHTATSSSATSSSATSLSYLNKHSGSSNEHVPHLQYVTPSTATATHTKIQSNLQQNKIVSSHVTAATGGSDAAQLQQQQQQQELYLELQPPAQGHGLSEEQQISENEYYIKSVKPQHSQLHYPTNNDITLNYDESTLIAPRQPAIEYGLPGGTIPSEIHNSNQFYYAPLRTAYDRKLPLSPKTVPYPPSFISLTTTTEKPRNQAYTFYSNDFKTVMNRKIPDLFSHRSSKSLLESYIPSWEVIKHLQQYKQQEQQQHVQEQNSYSHSSARSLLGNKAVGSHTLAFATPFRGYIKRHTNNAKH